MDNILEVTGLVKRYPSFLLITFLFLCRRAVSLALSEPMALGKLRRYALFWVLHAQKRRRSKSFRP